MHASVRARVTNVSLPSIGFFTDIVSKDCDRQNCLFGFCEAVMWRTSQYRKKLQDHIQFDQAVFEEALLEAPALGQLLFPPPRLHPGCRFSQ